jgi:hypothetical protein
MSKACAPTGRMIRPNAIQQNFMICSQVFNLY